MILVAAVAVSGVLASAGLASAQGTTANQFNTCRRDAGGTGGNCNNTQYGDNSGNVDQEGSASSGSGVAGQVSGVVSSGDVSVNASNRTDHVNVTTGNATGSNNGTMDVGTGIQIGSRASGPGGTANLFNVCRRLAGGPGGNCNNAQYGNNDGGLDQSANASSGDGIAGQIIGAVTTSGGSARLNLDNATSHANVTTGNGTFNNNSNAFVGRGIVIGSTVGP
jgi:hypothetical protein